jgi:hypothetical protein
MLEILFATDFPCLYSFRFSYLLLPERTNTPAVNANPGEEVEAMKNSIDMKNAIGVHNEKEVSS